MRILVTLLLLFISVISFGQEDTVPPVTPPPQDTARRVQPPPAREDTNENEPVVIRRQTPVRTQPRGDTTPKIDSSQLFNDSLLRKPGSVQESAPVSDSFFLASYYLGTGSHPFFGFAAQPIIIKSNLRVINGKEALFYSLISLLLVFAFIRNAFAKYLDDLYRMFFRTTLKQRQVREQLMQTPLPSLLLNLFFCLVGGIYVALVLRHYNTNPFGNFWLLFMYSAIALAIIYTGKYIGIRFSGWVFNARDAANSYIFIVFIINKIIGIFLLPVVVILAFTFGSVYQITLTLSWIGIAALFIYRFILTFATIRNQVRVNVFHFFVYLLAFEVIPVLLIYKLLLMVF